MQIQGQGKAALDMYQSSLVDKLTTSAGAEAQDAEGLKKVENGFEYLLARTLVAELRKTVEGGLFPSGAGSDVYAGWFDEHMAEVIAEQKALGVGELLNTELGDVTPEELAESNEEGAE